MKIDRYMANLFFEIKRNIPSSMQSGMKMSNPDIGDYMVQLYQETDDVNIKRLTEIFLERAGGEWPARLHPDRNSPQTRYYRGQEVKQVEQCDAAKETTLQPSKSKPQRIYRGQVVMK